MERLLEFGGFPEPFLKADSKAWKRWQHERLARVVNEDLLTLEKVNDVSKLSILSSLLPEKVGSILSLNSLREDLNIAHESAERWVSIFETLYFCYRISPYTEPKIKGLKKDKKLYLWDWSLCSNPGARWENLVASHLLKYCHFIEDTNGVSMSLHFIRDKEKREVDFLVCAEHKPLFAVECKSNAASLSRHIPYFAKRTQIPKFYQVHRGNLSKDVPEHRCEILPFTDFCKKVIPLSENFKKF